MFKVIKYLLLANLYKKAKKSILLLVGLFSFLLFFTLIINDLLSVESGINIQVLLLVKWIVIFTLVMFMVRTILQIINRAKAPFESEEVTSSQKIKELANKKEYILNRKRLLTEKDVILQKYMKDQ